MRNQQLRHYREIAEQLIREPNIGEMARLLKELNQASVELQKTEIILGWDPTGSLKRLQKPPKTATTRLHGEKR